MSGRVKRGGYKNGRGYCGWYTNGDGKKIFLRSTKEFICAKVLDFEKKHFLTEKAIFEINGNNYKPDFFIYENADCKKLIKIIEVKSEKRKAQKCLLEFKSFFNAIGVEYCVIWEFRKIIKEFNLEKEIEKWIYNFESKYEGISVAKENNPMWGIHHTNKTKKLIGEQTKKYMKDPDVKKRHSDSIKKFWNSENAKTIKEKYAKLRREEKTKRDIELDSANPMIDKKCIFCGKTYKDRKLGGRDTCSGSCLQKNNWKTGKIKYCADAKKGYKTRLINYAKVAKVANSDSIDSFMIKVSNAKKTKLIPKNFSMRENVIVKYFGSFANMKGEI